MCAHCYCPGQSSSGSLSLSTLLTAGTEEGSCTETRPQGETNQWGSLSPGSCLHTIRASVGHRCEYPGCGDVCQNLGAKSKRYHLFPQSPKDEGPPSEPTYMRVNVGRKEGSKKNERVVDELQVKDIEFHL